MKRQRAQWLRQFLTWIRQILILNLIFVGIGFFWRLAFLFLFGPLPELLKLKSDLVWAFILGARFDFTVLCYINTIPLLLFWLFITLMAFPRLAPWGERLLRGGRAFLAVYYTLFLCLISFINIVDLNYYSFYQDRINVLVFGFFTDDTTALVHTIWKNYPVVWVFGSLILATVLLFFFLRWLFKATPRPARKGDFESVPWVLGFVIFFALFFLNGVAARGSLGLFPLSEMDTGISSSPFINHLCFNSTRAFTRAIELHSKEQAAWNSNLKHYGYSDDARQAFADYYHLPLEKVPADPLELLQHRTAKNPWAEKTRPHVLLLVMESFGSYWLKYNSPDFDLLGDLKKHFAEDQYLTNFMSSTGATIGSLSSLMVGSMQRPGSAFLTEGEYLQVPFRTSPARIFKSAGYKTRFIYGGNPGWREVNKFARFQAFDTVEGENEIADGLGGLKEKHDWGVYDEDVWNYLWKTLQEAKEPQFVLTMTTTNHPPYQLPSTYQRPTLKIPPALQARLIGEADLPPKRFATYRYASQKLAEFITRIKNSPLKDKVIIAVTGDHTFWIVNFNNDELLQKSGVPFYLYMPPAIRKKLPADTFGSHPDILPTLYNLALSDTTYYTTATDLFAPSEHYALDHSSLILGPKGGVQMQGQYHYYDWAGHYDHLIPGQKNQDLDAMALHYKSLMGVLDYYMMKEKRLTDAHPGR